MSKKLILVFLTFGLVIGGFTIQLTSSAASEQEQILVSSGNPCEGNSGNGTPSEQTPGKGSEKGNERKPDSGPGTPHPGKGTPCSPKDGEVVTPDPGEDGEVITPDPGEDGEVVTPDPGEDGEVVTPDPGEDGEVVTPDPGEDGEVITPDPGEDGEVVTPDPGEDGEVITPDPGEDGEVITPDPGEDGEVITPDPGEDGEVVTPVPGDDGEVVTPVPGDDGEVSSPPTDENGGVGSQPTEGSIPAVTDEKENNTGKDPVPNEDGSTDPTKEKQDIPQEESEDTAEVTTNSDEIVKPEKTNDQTEPTPLQLEIPSTINGGKLPETAGPWFNLLLISMSLMVLSGFLLWKFRLRLY
jgi:hypothetical protein